ncbi:cysteine hydrolase [Flavobacterium agricola]|uniref:Cysteine hydrolase n=1 Tax=Flavobacterium agricola TaxID=2870839 RepID=A0ABY6M298_9FLAO|nr:cysteine hydrolase family protein [Flavobacterium agricola]UYW01902.1 cysteine hydrolase [Flavobacterium agricola]
MSFLNKNPALLLIDIQKGFLDESYWGGNRNNKNAEEISGSILQKWREYHLPIFHVQHRSTNPKSKLHPSNPGFAFQDTVLPLPNEPIITKHVNSAFIGTNLKQLLDEQQISTLVIVGLTTNHCVSTTTRMAGNYGYETYIISDATAAFNRVGIAGENYDSTLIHLTALANLNDEFATVWNSQQLFKHI